MFLSSSRWLREQKNKEKEDSDDGIQTPAFCKSYFCFVKIKRCMVVFHEDLRFYYWFEMSHLRDMQRLRQTRNLEPLTVPLRNQQLKPVDIYNINFDRLDPEPHSARLHPHSKEITSKESASTASRERRTSHQRGSSNPTNEPESPGLSIYNFSLKLNPKSIGSLTARREKNNSSELELGKGQVHVGSFERICAVGKGGFGKVWKVELKKTRQIFAMKEMYKAKIIAKKSINSVMNERALLARIRHPFFINITYAFQDRENLYLLMDYVNGGDLRYHIGRRRRFTEAESRFFIANLIVGLEYLHRNRIIHRDIKPENLVLDGQGYLRITDLGVSREWKEENYQDTSGTPGYMAPEVMCRKNHSFPADYFAVGVIAYEFMLGRRPYQGRNRKQIRDQVLSKQAAVRLQELPNRWSLDALNFTNQLLQRNPNNRLGAGGIEQLKRHQWMRGVDFARLQKKQLKAPYLPVSIEEDYEEYKEQISQDTEEDNFEENMLMLRDQQVQSLFEGYEYGPLRMEARKSTSN